MANKGSKKLNSFANDEHELSERRKRVAAYVDGDSVAYEDTSFATGDSPAVADVFSDLGGEWTGHEGYIVNDGPGDLLVEISKDGTNYGGQHTLKAYEELVLGGLRVNKIRLTWVSNTAYRIFIA